MNPETFNDILLPIMVTTSMVYFYRKVYYHFKFLGLHHSKLKGKSIITTVLFNPITLIEHFYIMIPVFIKSDRKKQGEELKLETKIVNSLWTFWIMFGLTLLAGLIVHSHKFNVGR